VDSTALDVGDFGCAAQVGRDIDGGQLLALLGEHFDAGVEGLVVELIAGDFLDVEVDSCCSGSFGIGGHLEFFGGGLLELGEEDGR
jgi:hypothetical protein